MIKSEEADSASELPVVAALRALSVFRAEQSGAYREHFGAFAAVFGEDAETRLARYVTGWARGGQPGAVILTGNAGTGKTAVAEAYCHAIDATLPDEDAAVEAIPGRWVMKDLSGLANPELRLQALKTVLTASAQGQALVCANEGVMRDALDAWHAPQVSEALETAL